MKRLHELDLASALVFGFASTWKRILLFFLACWFSVFVADVCELVGSASSLSDLFFEEYVRAFVRAPWTWLGAVVFGFDDAVAVLMFFVLCVALLMVLYMETGYWRGVFLVLLTQPIHELWLTTRERDKFPAGPWLLLAVYLAGLLLFYVRCLRCSRMG